MQLASDAVERLKKKVYTLRNRHVDDGCDGSWTGRWPCGAVAPQLDGAVEFRGRRWPRAARRECRETVGGISVNVNVNNLLAISI